MAKTPTLPTGSSNSRRGLTLIELLVVMAIMTVLAAVTAPSLAVAFREARLRSATRQLIALLTYTRSRAVVGGATTRANFVKPEQLEEADQQTVWVTRETQSEAGEVVYAEDTSPSGRARYLPVGVLVEVTKSEAPASAVETPAAEEDETVATVSFRRNGQTEEALLRISGSAGQLRYVRLEALTGRARLLSDEELAGDELGQQLESLP